MLPKLKSTNFEGMELIRPLYKVKEKDIINWSKYNELRFLQCACKFTAESAEHEEMSKRKEIKRLIADIKKINPNVDDNLFRSVHNVNLASIVGWRDSDSGEKHSYIENYDEI
jgi:tRNA(Ile)-lysidine synthase TilS/MesJ